MSGATVHTHASDRAIVDKAARALAANLMFPSSAAQALTAALRMIDRLRAEVDELKAQVY